MDRVFTKVVATLGPSSESPDMIAAMLQAGVDVFRLNMSHGDHAWHAAAIQAIRQASLNEGRPTGILCDLSGPKIRIGDIPGGPVTICPGDRITLTTEQVEGTASRVSVNFKGLPRDVRRGERLMLDDGLLEIEVEKIETHDVHCIVVRGGPLSSRKGLNLPHTRLSISSLTEKDRRDIEFGLANDVDMFALSFVRRARDIREARAYMQSHGGELPLIAKIEKGEAVENIDEVLEAADGAMVARGDLGVEIPIEKVPHVQKRVIGIANQMAKPVITATQMLDSMIRSSRPTRAEVTDVANAILDGTDAVMLSGETASGQFPLEAVEMMNRIARETQVHFNYEKRLQKHYLSQNSLVADSITRCAATVAQDLGVDAILCLTQGGSTARRVARYRPHGGVLAYCPVSRTAQQLCLVWGVTAFAREGMVDVEVERRQGAEVQIRKAVSLFRDRGVLKSSQRIVVAAGLPLHQTGTTNLIRVTDVD